MSEETTVDDVMTKLINERIGCSGITVLNKTTCMQTYGIIFDTLVEVLGQSKVQITNESMNFLAQEYYDSIRINDRQQLDPNIFEKRARLENIETKELALLYMMMRGTTTSNKIVVEIRRRS